MAPHQLELDFFVGDGSGAIPQVTGEIKQDGVSPAARKAQVAEEAPPPRTTARDLRSGEPVGLLSPAAASFDMFDDYAARGEAFRAAERR